MPVWGYTTSSFHRAPKMSPPTLSTRPNLQKENQGATPPLLHPGKLGEQRGRACHLVGIRSSGQTRRAHASLGCSGGALQAEGPKGKWGAAVRPSTCLCPPRGGSVRHTARDASPPQRVCFIQRKRSRKISERGARPFLGLQERAVHWSRAARTFPPRARTPHPSAQTPGSTVEGLQEACGDAKSRRSFHFLICTLPPKRVE